MDIDILVEAKEWETLGLDDLVMQALQATLAQFDLDPACVEISVLACGDERMAGLNREFRDKLTPTNVLSWPVDDLAADSDGGSPETPVPEPDGTIALGDVAISYETCRREAEDLNKPIAAHVTHLLVHGTLHLLGYDHIRDLDAALMQAIETEILGKMGLDDPYRT